MSTQINVTWTLPKNPNGVLLGYTLRYEASYPPDIDSSGVELPGPDATHLLVVDLHPGTSYNIDLLARNDLGMSDLAQYSGYTLSTGDLQTSSTKPVAFLLCRRSLSAQYTYILLT